MLSRPQVSNDIPFPSPVLHLSTLHSAHVQCSAHCTSQHSTLQPKLEIKLKLKLKMSSGANVTNVERQSLMLSVAKRHYKSVFWCELMRASLLSRRSDNYSAFGDDSFPTVFLGDCRHQHSPLARTARIVEPLPQVDSRGTYVLNCEVGGVITHLHFSQDSLLHGEWSVWKQAGEIHTCLKRSIGLLLKNATTFVFKSRL